MDEGSNHLKSASSTILLALGKCARSPPACCHAHIVNETDEDVDVLVAKKSADGHNRNECQKLANRASFILEPAKDRWETIFVRDAARRSAAIHVPAVAEITLRGPLSTRHFAPESFVVKPKDERFGTIAATSVYVMYVMPFMAAGMDNGEGAWYQVAPKMVHRW
ncbi:hypothetical protein AMAG_10157 [Allomyces macrogynus ATCC 38327]|uniref:Uncharacterized protein n=1 Tax=Allomyces macrogynus (strain ATCC 38327) TaxID=578462 RepID=A0A0L0SQP2_ALLM3|nr:hypothetical protein AMAG_10157 [Allomyces macrogynus ATCC 38327]|eukprot:KNE64822.1 hypothetical protein AMAG_10157 [Allomyces macrogynus ATCC 38327]